MKKLKKFFNLTHYSRKLFLAIIVLTLIHQLTYSFVPVFTQTLIKIIKNFQAGLDFGHDVKVSLPQIVLNFIIHQTDIMQAIFTIAFSLFVLQVFRFSLRFLELHLKGIFFNKTAESLRVKMFDHIQNLSFTFHNHSDSGDLLQRVTTDIEKTTSFLTQDMIEVVYLVGTIIFGSLQLFYINHLIVVVTLVMLPIVALSSIIYFKKVDKLFIDIEESESQMMRVIQENLSQAKTVRSFANEAYEIDKLEVKNKENQEKQIKANKMVAKYWGTMDVIAVCQYMFVIFMGVVYFRNKMDSADLIASLALIGMLIWPVRGLGRTINNFGKAMIAQERLYEILNVEEEYEKNGDQTFEIKGKIEFKNVYFKYPDVDDYILENVSFVIHAFEKACFIGQTGSGKTTLIHLLLKMYKPTNGQILIDDVLIENIETHHLRKHIGVVMQDPFLYSKTIYENIEIAHKKAKKEDVYEAARIAALDQEIKMFEKGYDTMVGEKGTTLSGGQKQRVAIARVLLKKAPILVFDDALSALDNQTDRAVQTALGKQNQTMIIVTHRMSTAKQADKIFVLENKTIVAAGTHEALIHVEGLYQRLWHLQNDLEQIFLESVEAKYDG